MNGNRWQLGGLNRGPSPNSWGKRGRFGGRRGGRGEAGFFPFPQSYRGKGEVSDCQRGEEEDGECRASPSPPVESRKFRDQHAVLIASNSTALMGRRVNV